MKPRILLIDQHTSALELLRDLLEALGCRVTSAVTADQALRRYVDERPQLVFLDLLLPETTESEPNVDVGLKLLQSIKEIHEQARIVVLLAPDTLPQADQATQLGAIDILVKPFAPQGLRTILSREFSPKRLKLRFEVSEFADEEETAILITRLFALLNRAHIAGGGAGLYLDDWEILVSQDQLEDVPV